MDLGLLNDDRSVVAGTVGILDMKCLTLAHAAQMNFGLVKQLMILNQEGYPMRQKGMHYLHLPPGFETLFNFFKSLMKKKLQERICIHSDNSYSSLHKHIPKEILPFEYGGTAGKFDDMAEEFNQLLIQNRDWFLRTENLRSDESKRIGKSKLVADMFGVDGSFRKLEVD